VEWSIEAEREPAFLLVELHGGDAQVHQDAPHARDASFEGQPLQLTEVASREAECTGFYRLAPLGRRLQLGKHVGILVDAQDVGPQREQTARVAPGPERAVDIPLARCHVQVVQDLLGHDWYVWRHHQGHPISSLKRSGAGGASWTASRFASQRASFHISRRLGAPTNMTFPSRAANLRRGAGRLMRPAESSLVLAAPE